MPRIRGIELSQDDADTIQQQGAGPWTEVVRGRPWTDWLTGVARHDKHGKTLRLLATLRQAAGKPLPGLERFVDRGAPELAEAPDPLHTMLYERYVARGTRLEVRLPEQARSDVAARYALLSQFGTMHRVRPEITMGQFEGIAREGRDWLYSAFLGRFAGQAVWAELSEGRSGEGQPAAAPTLEDCLDHPGLAAELMGVLPPQDQQRLRLVVNLVAHDLGRRPAGCRDWILGAPPAQGVPDPKALQLFEAFIDPQRHPRPAGLTDRQFGRLVRAARPAPSPNPLTRLADSPSWALIEEACVALVEESWRAFVVEVGRFVEQQGVVAGRKGAVQALERLRETHQDLLNRQQNTLNRQVGIFNAQLRDWRATPTELRGPEPGLYSPPAGRWEVYDNCVDGGALLLVSNDLHRDPDGTSRAMARQVQVQISEEAAGPSARGTWVMDPQRKTRDGLAGVQVLVDGELAAFQRGLGATVLARLPTVDAQRAGRQDLVRLLIEESEWDEELRELHEAEAEEALAPLRAELDGHVAEPVLHPLDHRRTWTGYATVEEAWKRAERLLKDRAYKRGDLLQRARTSMASPRTRQGLAKLTSASTSRNRKYLFVLRADLDRKHDALAGDELWLFGGDSIEAMKAQTPVAGAQHKWVLLHPQQLMRDRVRERAAPSAPPVSELPRKQQEAIRKAEAKAARKDSDQQGRRRSVSAESQ